MTDMVPYSNRRGVRRLSEDLGVAGVMPPQISIRGNRFTLVDASGERFPWPDMHMDVVIIDANPKSRVYFGRDYDPADESPPVCFSDNGVGPSKNASEPQGRTCAECPMSGWGSAVSKMTGKGIPACKEYRKVACIVISGQPSAQRYDVQNIEGMPYMLMIPPNSLKKVSAYSQRIGQYPMPGTNEKLDVCDIITRLSFDPGQLGTLNFQEVGYLTPDIVEAINGTSVETTNNMVGLNDVPWQGPPRIAAPQPAP